MHSTIRQLVLSVLIASASEASLVLNPTAVNPSLFSVSIFHQGSGPVSISQLFDQSILIGTGDFGAPSLITRFTDVNLDRVADGAGTVLYSAPGGGPVTGLVKAGDYYFAGLTQTRSIAVLQAGLTATDPMTEIGSLQFGFPANWIHQNMGIAARPVSGQPNAYDLVFNVGSQNNGQSSSAPVALSGLLSANLDGDSLYAVRIQLNGNTATASNLQKVASGIRNVVGMGFHPVTGDFYFADNAIDGPGVDGDDPPQAEELNRIPAAVFGTGPLHFGYPDCYIQYRTGAQVGSGCELPLAAFQPIPFPNGFESEGPGQLAFAPSNFPAGFNNGVFVGFSGKYSIGPSNEENALVYYDFGSGNYIHFVESGGAGLGTPVGLYSNQTSLFVADFAAGSVYQITAADTSVPEPGSVWLVSAAVLAFLVRKIAVRA